MIIKEIFEIPVFSDARILAGDTGLENEIIFTTIMDIPNMAEWLHGGELICAGVLLRQCLSEDFLRSLKEKKAAGIVTKAKFTEGFTPSLLELCQTLQLPVIIVADRYNWSELMNPIITAITKMQYTIINETQKFHDLLMESLLQNESLSLISEKVCQITGMSVAIINNGLRLVSHTEALHWDYCIKGLSHHNLVRKPDLSVNVDGNPIPGFVFQNHYLSETGQKLFLYEIEQANVRYGYVAIAVEKGVKQLSTQEIMKVQQLSLISALAMSKKNAIDNATRKYNNLLLDEILQANSSQPMDTEKIGHALGVKLEQNYTIVIVNSPERLTTDVIMRNQYADQFYKGLKRDISYFEKLLIFEYGNNYIVFIAESYPALESAVKKIQMVYNKVYGSRKVCIGISMVNPFIQALKSYRQALQALNYAVNYTNSTYFFYADLGILRFFMDEEHHLSIKYLTEFHERYVVPLLEYDKKNHTSLFETLDAYIKNNCSKVNTEKCLFIHKNTLIARLNTIDKVVGCDLGTSEDMFHMQMAMKINYFFQHMIQKSR